MPRTQQEVHDFFEAKWSEIMRLREAGQAEYAHADSNAFANFERTASQLGLDPKHVLWIFANKHHDGITSYLKGHTSQREDVTGRISDLIVYLFLLWAMIEEERAAEEPEYVITTTLGPPIYYRVTSQGDLVEICDNCRYPNG